jgi:hypothetical protein
MGLLLHLHFTDILIYNWVTLYTTVACLLNNNIYVMLYEISDVIKKNTYKWGCCLVINTDYVI